MKRSIALAAAALAVAALSVGTASASASATPSPRCSSTYTGGGTWSVQCSCPRGWQIHNPPWWEFWQNRTCTRNP